MDGILGPISTNPMYFKEDFTYDEVTKFGQDGAVVEEYHARVAHRLCEFIDQVRCHSLTHSHSCTHSLMHSLTCTPHAQSCTASLAISLAPLPRHSSSHTPRYSSLTHSLTHHVVYCPTQLYTRLQVTVQDGGKKNYFCICIPCYNESMDDLMKTVLCLLENIDFMKHEGE
jgi:hypothetical protein